MPDEKPQSTPILVKKYANRRLYDTVHSTYVNLKQIADLIRVGNTVSVIDASSGEDLTKLILTQIILEQEKDQRNLLPTDFLHQIIQYGEFAYEDFLDKFLLASRSAYRTAQEQMEAVLRDWMKPWAAPPAAPAEPSDVADLKARIAELEARLQAPKSPPR